MKRNQINVSHHPSIQSDATNISASNSSIKITHAKTTANNFGLMRFSESIKKLFTKTKTNDLSSSGEVAFAELHQLDPRIDKGKKNMVQAKDEAHTLLTSLGRETGSNHQKSKEQLEKLKTIQSYISYVPIEDVYERSLILKNWAEKLNILESLPIQYSVYRIECQAIPFIVPPAYRSEPFRSADLTNFDADNIVFAQHMDKILFCTQVAYHRFSQDKSKSNPKVLNALAHLKFNLPQKTKSEPESEENWEIISSIAASTNDEPQKIGCSSTSL